MKYYKQILLIIITFILIILPLSACSNGTKSMDRVDLRSNYKGKSLTGTFTMRVNITDVHKSVFTNASIIGSFDITYEAGIYNCVLESLHVKIDSTDASIDYDSVNTYSDEKVIVRNTPYESFLGVQFKATVDSTGRISSLLGFDKVDENINRELTDYGQNTLDQATFAAREYLDESVLNMLLSFFIGYAPDKGLKPNDHWTYNSKTNSPYMVNNELSCSLIGSKDDKYVISTVGTIKAAVEEKNYTGLEYALTGTSDSKIYVSKENNIIRNGSYIENITGYCYYKVNDSDIKDTITMTRNITFTLESGAN